MFHFMTQKNTHNSSITKYGFWIISLNIRLRNCVKTLRRQVVHAYISGNRGNGYLGYAKGIAGVLQLSMIPEANE